MSRNRRQWLVGLCSFALVLVAATGTLVLGIGPGSVPAQAANAATTYLTLSVTPTQGLVTGEPMTVTVSRTAAGTAAGVEIFKVGYAWCAPGTVLTPPQTMNNVGGSSHAPPAFPSQVPRTVVCTTYTHSLGHPTLNGAPVPISTISPPVNATGNYPSVSGTTFAQETQGRTLSHGQVTCDPTHPCTFAVAVYVNFKTPAMLPTPSFSSGAVYYLKTGVTYRPTTANLACGGAATGQFTSAGPDSLGQMATTWAVDACQAKVGGGKALTRVETSSGSDQLALCTFAAGKADLAYSAVGYGTASSSFNPANCTGKVGGPQPDRPYVAVPVALNAAVLAHDETLVRTTVSNGTAFKDYSQLDVTDGQLAQLLSRAGRAQSWSNGTLGPALLAEDPTLTGDFYYGVDRTSSTAPSVNSTSTLTHHTTSHGTGIVVTSGTTATAFVATRFLRAVASKTLISITKTPAPLGTVASFSLASPRFNVDPSTGLINIVHLLTPTNTTARGHGGLPWALLSATDADAIFFGMANFAVQTPGSNPPVYVPADKTTMQAAVSGMTPQADGTLLPNATDHTTKAYPLTYVEYAIVPAQPLITSSCTLQTQTELNLFDWLDYITGAGQTELPKGMAPLTTSLQAQAQAAIAKIGQTPITCTLPTGGKKTVTGSTGTGSGTTTSTSGAGHSATGSSTTGTASGGSGASGTATVASSSGSANASRSGANGTSGRSGFGSSGRGTATRTASGANGRGGTAKTGNGSNGGGSSHGGPAAADLANFKVAEGPSWLVPAVGVLLLFLLLPGLVLLASGRSPRQAVAALGRLLHLKRPPGGSP